MTQINRITPLFLVTINTSDTTDDSWTAVNAEGFEAASFMLRITNDSNKKLLISFDGINPHEWVNYLDRIEINFQTHSSPNNYVSKMRRKTVVYLKEFPQKQQFQDGDVYIAGYYN